MDFEQRMQKAVQRGQNRRDEKTRAERAKTLSKEEMKSRHSTYRLQLSDHIESCLAKLPNQFPGFQFETIYGERGWGAACFRDDVGPSEGGKRANFYSRIELTIRPFSDYHILELAAKATTRNKEIFNRDHYEELSDVDTDQFVELIDLWVLEYAKCTRHRVD